MSSIVADETDNVRTSIVQWISASEHLPSKTDMRIVSLNKDGVMNVCLNQGDWVRYFEDWYIVQWTILNPPKLVENEIDGS